MRPSPLHFLHGDCTTVPSPEQVGHGATLTNCPKNERWARRTSPDPAHVAHRCTDVPGSAPLPSHLSHGSRRRALIDRSAPVATSASVSGTVTSMSAPEREPAPSRCPVNRSPKPWNPPKSRMKMRSEEHTSELQSPCNLVCRLLLEKK